MAVRDVFVGEGIDVPVVARIRGRNEDIARNILKDAGLIDSLARGPRRVAVVAYGERVGSAVGTTLSAELRRAGHQVAAVRLSPASGPASYDSAGTIMAERDYVVVAVAVRARQGAGTVAMPAALASLIAAAGPRGALVSFGSPYLIGQVPEVGTCLMAWETNPLTERAAAAALGGAAITGRLPVSFPPEWPVGAGIGRRGGR